MAQNRVDLVNIFQAVTQTLADNQQVLNQEDEYNHDHGTNMVQTFETITNSLQQKQGKSDITALTYAGKKLTKNTTSGSGKLYAQGLTQAAPKFKGKKVDSKGALDLLQTLIGGGQSTPQAGGSDILGTLLGQMTGGTQSQPSSASQPGEDVLTSLLGGITGGSQTQATQSDDDMLGALLGGLTGGQATSSGSGNGLDIGDLLNAGLSYMQAKESGGSTTQALVQAFMTASGMGNSTHRVDSTSLVVNSFLQALATSAKSAK
jgi:hypothetical protein